MKPCDAEHPNPTQKVGTALRPTHDKLDNILHALRSIQDKTDLQPHDLRPYRYARNLYWLVVCIMRPTD